jgi:hypothetical protein
VVFCPRQVTASSLRATSRRWPIGSSPCARRESCRRPRSHVTLARPTDRTSACQLPHGASMTRAIKTYRDVASSSAWCRLCRKSPGRAARAKIGSNSCERRVAKDDSAGAPNRRVGFHPLCQLSVSRMHFTTKSARSSRFCTYPFFDSYVAEKRDPHCIRCLFAATWPTASQSPSLRIFFGRFP